MRSMFRRRLTVLISGLCLAAVTSTSIARDTPAAIDSGPSATSDSSPIEATRDSSQIEATRPNPDSYNCERRWVAAVAPRVVVVEPGPALQ